VGRGAYVGLHNLYIYAARCGDHGAHAFASEDLPFETNNLITGSGKSALKLLKSGAAAQILMRIDRTVVSFVAVQSNR
jgi:hypothetical protein